MNGESLWQCRACEWEGPRSEVHAFRDPGSYPGPFAGELLHHCPECGMQADDTGRAITMDQVKRMSRDCATCRHRVRHRGRDVCTRILALMTGEQLGRLRQWFARAPECWQERASGRYVSLVFRECGRDGRYWRAR